MTRTVVINDLKGFEQAIPASAEVFEYAICSIEKLEKIVHIMNDWNNGLISSQSSLECIDEVLLEQQGEQ